MATSKNFYCTQILFFILLLVFGCFSLKSFSKSNQTNKKPQPTTNTIPQTTAVSTTTPKTTITPQSSTHATTISDSASAPTTPVNASPATSVKSTEKGQLSDDKTVSVTPISTAPIQVDAQKKQTIDQSPQEVEPIEQKFGVQGKQKDGEIQQKENLELKPPYSYKIKKSQNQYVIPIQIDSQQYNLAILYQQKSSKYGEFPSWIFTSLTNDNEEKEGVHQICDKADDCQTIKKYVRCSSKKSKGEQQCMQQGNLKYNEQNIKCRKKVKVTYKNENTKFQSIFASPSKITLSDTKIGQQQIQGLINLGLDNQLDYTKSNSIILNRDNLTVVSSQFLQNLLKHNQQLDLDKGGILSLFSQNSLYIRAQNSKTGKQINNVQQKYNKIIFRFNRADLTMAVSSKILTVIKNILKKSYFGQSCHVNDNSIVCSKQPIKDMAYINFCRDKKGEKCFKLKILGQIVKQGDSSRQYSMLIQQNKSDDDSQDNQDTIILYPKFAEAYQLYAQKGVIKGVLYLGDIQQNQVAKNQVKGATQGQLKSKSKKSKKQMDSQQDNSKKEDEQGQTKSQAESQKQSQKKSQQDDSQKQNRKKNRHKKQSLKSKTQNSKSQIGGIQQQKSYSRGLLFFLFVYGGIFVFVLSIIKITAKQSMAAALIDRFLQITWYRIINSYFHKSQGYNSPKFEDQENVQEEIDRSDSIAVGISQKEGKTLFWEKNSVQGI